MGDSYDWFDQKRTMELLDENQLAPDARKAAQSEKSDKSTESEDSTAPLPSVRPAIEHWYENLPEKVRPTVLRCKYPHILTRIAQTWESPRQVHEAMNELLVDDRGNREGFPFAVIRELHCLRDFYFDVLRPDARDFIEPKQGLNTMLR